MRISAREACVKPHLRTRSDIKKNYSVFTVMQMYGRRHKSKTLPWVQFQTFLETFFTCNDIDQNINKI